MSLMFVSIGAITVDIRWWKSAFSVTLGDGNNWET